MNRWSIKDFLMQAMIAAIYTVLVYVFRFASFGLIQFRVAEVLMILVFFDKKSIVGLTLGCFISNWVSGAIAIDIFLGPIGTLTAGIFMTHFKKAPYIALSFPAIANGIVVGLILTYGYLLGPLWITIPAVFIGEFAVLYILGLPLYLLLKQNKGFLEFFNT